MPRNISASRPGKSEQVPPGYSIDPTITASFTVPTLASTTAKYLEIVQPHQTKEEFGRTKKAAEEFASSDLGKELQRRLEARAANNETGPNWLQIDPVVVFVSYFFVHVDDKLRRTPEKRAAALIRAMLPFRELVETQQLIPDKAVKYNPQQNNHITFIRKNKFYTVDLDHEGVQLSTAELESQIKRVIDVAGTVEGPAIGALTSENRDIWTDAREALLAVSPSNAEALRQIESSVIIVALDDSKPVTREAISSAVWAGNAKNRFYDKHQFIVFDNGRSGFLGEHSCMDGTPTLRMNEFIISSVARGKVDHGSPSVRPNIPQPKEVTFKLDAKTNKYIIEATEHYNELVAQHSMDVLHYEGYGSSYIKKHKISPDAWVQMVKQLAFHKLTQRPSVVYESAQTRKFQLGRTEVIRSTSNEAKAFVEAMEDPHATDKHRSELLRRAAARHLQYAAWAADGQGVDRHLFGLKKLLREGEPTPSIYTDPAFSKTNHWELSTSQLSSPWFDGWGYGEVVPDGFGLSYAIGADYLRWTITTITGKGAELKHYLAEAATEIKRMTESAAHEAEVKARL
ncbi:acyltransferase ChoActase/COT/CPT [Cantharellus anzutake]|uniref:acyltransferase ChoActase/COT/CPT n=1 Tax=Cantharellus anzutake TaxID=1750568 RepID=UPI001905C7D0|nr:acyltransferase ChoActase/COT/CPT [Cantharellus anzutake]KAF8326968.1 acyltransferase ChoActase/COT/CPT [Cantharellus anzutake]